jgi:hypothetical protein
MPVSEGPGYTVGYGRPPTDSQFRPGRSGNPRGRPRGAKSIKTLAREALTAKVNVRTERGQRRVSRMEALLMKAVEMASRGDMRALTQLMQLYAAAVPEAAPTSIQQTGADEDLTAADLAILEAFLASKREVAGGAE